MQRNTFLKLATDQSGKQTETENQLKLFFSREQQNKTL